MPTVMGWVRQLEAKIKAQAAYERPFNERYRNEWVLPFIAAEYRQVYGDDAVKHAMSIAPPRSGVAAIGIDALTERLRIVEAVADPGGDGRRAALVVNQAWEDSDLDVMHPEAHREALIGARSWGFVSRERNGSRAVGSIESARQCAGHDH